MMDNLMMDPLFSGTRADPRPSRFDCGEDRVGAALRRQVYSWKDGTPRGHSSIGKLRRELPNGGGYSIAKKPSETGLLDGGRL